MEDSFLGHTHSPQEVLCKKIVYLIAYAAGFFICRCIFSVPL